MSKNNIKTGDKVRWTGYTPINSYIEQWEPFEVLRIEDSKAQLELISFLVPISELVKVNAQT